MGKLVSIIGGTVAVVLGVVGLLSWWWSFVELIKGVLPCILILGGLIALMAGISEIKDAIFTKKEEPKAEEPAA